MRGKRGSRDEVLNKIYAPSGSCYCAEITDGDGRTNTVRYKGLAGTADETAEARMTRKGIQLCRPLPEMSETFAPGDAVEVFDDFSWKVAVITKVLNERHFLTRIVGSCSEFEVSQSHIQRIQPQQHELRIVIGKGSCGDANENSKLKAKRNSRNSIHPMKTRLKVGSFSVRNNEKRQESTVISCRTLKRGPCGRNSAEKFRVVEKEGTLHRVLAANHSSFAENADITAFPRELVGEKFTHSSFYSETGFTETDVERRKQIGVVRYSSAIELESNDEDSVSSSVGSCCLASKNYYKMHHRTSFIEDTDGSNSDAESFCHNVHKESNVFYPTNEELAAEIHRLELYAYRCTMEALYASGPLSWEQEELVTNLRLFLHISNDEHLMEHFPATK